MGAPGGRQATLLGPHAAELAFQESLRLTEESHPAVLVRRKLADVDELDGPADV